MAWGFFLYLRGFIKSSKIENFRNKAAKYINKSRERKKKNDVTLKQFHQGMTF